MSSVLVVVIVGVIIVVISVATARDGSQPPTPGTEAPRDAHPMGPSAPEPWTPPDLPVAPAALPVEDRSRLHRFRSAVLLVVVTVVLGSVAAGLLGGAVYLGAHVLNRALG